MRTHCERILQYMKQHGRISQAEGFVRLNITCTSQRITDLRKRGHDIITRMETSATGARYAVWSLGGKKCK
jgi:hypothetical protein